MFGINARFQCLKVKVMMKKKLQKKKSHGCDKKKPKKNLSSVLN